MPETRAACTRGAQRQESLYRCAECGHGRDLTAWGNASVHGKLGADGEIESYDWDEVWEIHEDSIQCGKHPDPVLEKLIGGQWCRWWDCPRCHGQGDRCPEEGIRPAGTADRRTAHAGWWPSGEPWPVSTLDRRGHVFTPGMDPSCRHCRALAGSIAGRELACKGDQHQCPVLVAKGASVTARQVYGRNDWVCFQPGRMNADFTAWECGAGHVITCDGRAACVDGFRNPRDFLVAAELAGSR